MGKFKILFVIAYSLILFFTSCGTKQVYVDRVQIDTIQKIERIYLPQTQQIEIDKPCDSLGNLKPFTLYTSNGKSKIKVISKDNIIRIEANLDSIKEVTERELRSQIATSKEVIEKKVIPKWVWYSLLANLFSIIIAFFWLKGKFFPF